MRYILACQHNARALYTLVAMFSVLRGVSEGLQCPPCSKIHCTTRQSSKLKCIGGVTTGVCNCCPACAKLDGEKCGGDFQYLGKCDKGLYCKPIKKNFAGFVGKDPEGLCHRGPQADEGVGQFCQPKCSPRFCRQNPKSVCSASDVAEVRRECHGGCQHTSCSACSFQREPRCPACRKDDFKCLKKFGKCIKRQTCSRKKFPCKWRKLKIQERGKFVCQVPKCRNAS